MQLHQLSPLPTQVKLSSTKACVTKVHSSHHLHIVSTITTLGVVNYSPGRQSGQNRAANDLHATPTKLPRRHRASIRSNQTHLRPLQAELYTNHYYFSQKQPQAQQDRTRGNQLWQSSFRQCSSSPTDIRSSFTGASFPKTLRALKERIPLLLLPLLPLLKQIRKRLRVLKLRSKVKVCCRYF